jgi:glycosyltransferase involved in cell wall biosynthesis
LSKFTKPTIICLTPVKNEAWILERFLKCASLWADQIIIADQNSDDGSVEIARSFEKVTLIQNKSLDFDESQRQKLLIDAARQFASPRLLVALDADEILTPNFQSSPEWQTILSSSPGTVIRFQRANLRPDMRHYWTLSFDFPFGFNDDGSTHAGSNIHSTRVPFSPNAPTITLRDIKVMHYQYTDWERMQSKHRWYQCWERINAPKRSSVSIYRQYYHMDGIATEDIQPIPSWWLDGYGEKDIDMTSIQKDKLYKWDNEVLNCLEQYGVKYFSKVYIWDIDWKIKALLYGYDVRDAEKYYDPRNLVLKRLHVWLKRTQANANSIVIRSIDQVLSKLF